MIIPNLGASLGHKHTIFLFKMTQFWRLFASDYVQEFVDSVSMPTVDEILEMYRSPFEKELKGYRENIENLLQQIPTF